MKHIQSDRWKGLSYVELSTVGIAELTDSKAVLCYSAMGKRIKSQGFDKTSPFSGPILGFAGWRHWTPVSKKSAVVP